ncbi:TPA: penicillin-binding protein 2, partial [Candidatus Micrarchaeota archaeon]|nr:penicillin-binding protein 2 [Candidatus Micrarchaeota archaeon]
MTKPELLVGLLEEVLGYPPKKATELVYREGYFTWIARRLESWKGEELRRRAEELGIEGLLFFDTWTRAYPEGRYTLEILGVVGVDGAGLEGLEYAFDRDLKGKSRALRLLRGGDGAIYRVEAVDEGKPGRDLYLTLDAEIQRICAEVLEKGTRIFRANRGFVIVMRPTTGEILALAQYPRFDPRDPDPALLHPWAVTDPFEPGSTFKALVGAAALDRGVVSPGEVFSAVSPFYVDGVPIRNANNVSLPEVTFARAITSSLNTVFLQVALRLGKETTWEYLVRFGIGEPTGIELPGESPGILRPPEEWTRVDLATISFGQGVSVNGVQLARAFCAIATDGLLPKAHLIAGHGGPRRTVISPKAAYTMRELLRLAVEFKYGGTGRWADVEGFGVAGKSGTAQKLDPRGGYSKTRFMGAMA